MRPHQVVAAVAALLLVAAHAATLWSYPNTTYSGGAGWLLALNTLVAVSLVVAGARNGGHLSLLLIGAFWLAPELAGALELPAWLRTLCEAYGWALPALVLAAVLLSGQHLNADRRGPPVLLAALAVLAFALRLWFVDPFTDPQCWRLCEHNWFSLQVELPVTVARLALVAEAVILVWVQWPVLRQSNRTGSLGWPHDYIFGLLGALALAAHTALGARTSWSQASLAVLVAAQLLFLGYALMWVPPRARRWRLERRLARLVTVLASVPSGDALVQQLQQATRDDSLTVRYWSPGRAGYVNGIGEPGAQTLSSARVLTSVHRAGRPVAVIEHSGRVDAAQLERAIDPALRVMLENAQLRAASLAELTELTDSRARVVQRAEVERRQLERNLHDGAQQRAVSLALTVRMLVSQTDVDGSGPSARQAQSLAIALLAELRAVARGIYPAVLTDSGLAGAADDLAERSSQVAVVVRHVPTRRYAPALERAAYLVLEAACADARARGATLVSIRGACADPLVLEVTDDATVGSPQVADLQDHVQALGGELIVSSHHDGTSVQVKLPCES
jgi:hypothetical protein